MDKGSFVVRNAPLQIRMQYRPVFIAQSSKIFSLLSGLCTVIIVILPVMQTSLTLGDGL
jgi:hypothetical protein